MISSMQEVRAVNTGISIMLLGSIGFMMGLFYLVNQKEFHMRKYTWMVISSTISIFSAVLLFQAVNGVVEAYVLGEEPLEAFELLVGMLHFLLWFLLLQFLLGLLSGTKLLQASSMHQAPESTGAEPDHHSLMETSLNLKTGGILLGHVAGFAAINCFGVLQTWLPHNFLVVLSVFPFAWGSIFALSRLTQALRDRVANADGKLDASEEMWIEEAAETENDVIGLAASFMVVQSLRLLIGGTLPNAEGEEPEDITPTHSGLQVMLLCGAGLFFVILEVVRIVKFSSIDQGSIDGIICRRVWPQLKNIVAMDFAWCVFFSSEWFVAAHFFTRMHGMMQEITVALFVTAVALALIFLLDKVEELESTGAAVDSCCRSVIKAIGMLIGFCWEKAFDQAVVDFTTGVTFFPRVLTKLVLALLLAMLVVPAWRYHIMPRILAYELREQEMEEELANNTEPTPGGSSGNSLAKPMLTSKKKASMKRADSAFGLDTPALHRKCKEYKSQIKVLQQRLSAGETGLQGHVIPKAEGGLPSNSELQQRNLALESRNRQLEAALAGVSSELTEMRRLAEVLRN